jgi:aspartokinase-like uncharacterized kinase
MRRASLAVAEAPTAGNPPLVIKIGGSLAETGRLRSVIPVIAAARVPAIIVPGGGPFADSVRRLQPELSFSDAVAHRLAMLAMQQMAEFIVAHDERFAIAETRDEIGTALARRQIPVWAPLRIIAGDTTIPADWRATSDTLAARLGELLGGARLVLLKSVDVRNESADELAARSVVDPIFPSIVARSTLSWSIFGPGGDKAFAALLKGEGDG